MMKSGGTPAVDDPAMWNDEGLPWASISDMSRSPTVAHTDRRVSALGVTTKALPVGEPGTLLFAMYASVGAVAVLGVKASWNQAILGIEPRQGMADSRFVRYWLEHLKPDLMAITRSNTQANLNADQVGNLAFPFTPILVQRLIADYLDRQTARIDALIAAKRRMEELLEERWQGLLETTIQALLERFGDTRLKYVCREIVVGIVVTPSAWYADSGIPAIRGMNVSPGVISQEDLVYLSPEGDALHPKSRLGTGDVVVVRTGQAGAAAVVPPEFHGWNCIDLVIIRPSADYSPHFLEHVLNSDWMQKHVAEHSVGTIQSHFNVGAASVVPVPQAPRAEQDAAAERLGVERMRVKRLLDAVRGQILLLRERREALITAAVRGESDLSEAA
jgi:type I restriction enzyme S subunit